MLRIHLGAIALAAMLLPSQATQVHAQASGSAQLDSIAKRLGTPSIQIVSSRQSVSEKPSPAGEIEIAELALEVGAYSGTSKAPDAVALAKGYLEIAANPQETIDVLARAASFYSSKANAKGAGQVSQLADEQQLRLSLLRAAHEARLIQQNERIIQLLERISKKT